MTRLASILPLLLTLTMGCTAAAGPVDDDDKASVDEFTPPGVRLIPRYELDESGQHNVEELAIASERRVEPTVVVSEDWMAVYTPDLVLRPEDGRMLRVKVSGVGVDESSGLNWYGFVLRVRNRGTDDAWEEIAPPVDGHEDEAYWREIYIVPHAGVVVGWAPYADWGLRISGGTIPAAAADIVIQEYAGAPASQLEFQVLVLPFYNPGEFEGSDEERYIANLSVNYEGLPCGEDWNPSCDVDFGDSGVVRYCAYGGHAMGVVDGSRYGLEEGVRCVPKCDRTIECGEGEICAALTDELKTCARIGNAMWGESCTDVERGEAHEDLCGRDLTCRQDPADIRQFNSIERGIENISLCLI